MTRRPHKPTLFPYTTLFRSLDPDNPLAHYYYAVALSNRGQEPEEDSAMEAELKRRSEEHTSELQSHHDLVCRLLLEKKKRPSSPPAPAHESRYSQLQILLHK